MGIILVLVFGGGGGGVQGRSGDQIEQIAYEGKQKNKEFVGGGGGEEGGSYSREKTLVGPIRYSVRKKRGGLVLNWKGVDYAGSRKVIGDRLEQGKIEKEKKKYQ